MRAPNKSRSPKFLMIKLVQCRKNVYRVSMAKQTLHSSGLRNKTCGNVFRWADTRWICCLLHGTVSKGAGCSFFNCEAILSLKNLGLLDVCLAPSLNYICIYSQLYPSTPFWGPPAKHLILMLMRTKTSSSQPWLVVVGVCGWRAYLNLKAPFNNKETP